jgi:hypothetical protein
MKEEGLLVLRLGHNFRFFFGGLALFILFFVFTDSDPTASNIGPYLIVVFSVLSSLYHETWVFDKRSHKIIHRHGLLLAYKQNVIEMADVEAFKISHFTTNDVDTDAKQKQFLQARYLKFSLIHKMGSVHVIEVLKKSGLSELEKKAKQVARFCEVNLESEAI